MRKIIAVLLGCIFLAACERPATITSWSPINDVNTQVPESLTTAAESPTKTPDIQESGEKGGTTPLPTFDIKELPDQLPASLKGYELVSWQTNGDWNFTLVTGTNREKTFDELMSPENQITDDGYVKITVSGVEQIKKVLDLLPAESQVFWGGMDLSGQVPEGTVYFSYPSKKIINELTDFCVQRKIDLINLAEPE